MISIIIPVYNRADLLWFTLESIINSDDVEKEIIIVDDHSTEDIFQTILFFQDKTPILYIKNLENFGGAKSRNIGLSLAKYSYVMFIDSDDLFEIDFFKKRFLKFRTINDESVAALYGPWVSFEGEGAFNSNQIVPNYSDYPLVGLGESKIILSNLLGGWFINLNTLIWKREFLDNIGGFREDLLINQDVDLCFRTLISGSELLGFNFPTCYYRIHNQGRVGVIDSNHKKLKQIFLLRLDYYSKLLKEFQDDKFFLDEMASYSYSMWSAYNQKFPMESELFFRFCLFLNPKFIPAGSWSFQILCQLFGLKKGNRIKNFINKYVRNFKPSK